MKKGVSIALGLLIYCIFAFSVLLAFSAFWMLKTWPNMNMSELVFQLSQGFAGTGNDILKHYFISAGLPALIVVVLMGGVLLVFRSRRWLQRLSLFLCSILCAAIAVNTVYREVDVEEYVVSQSIESEFIQDEYADPATTPMIFPEQKRNLIYIYLESMEVTFTNKENGGAFDQNMITELTQLAKDNECFAGDSSQLNGGYSMPGTTWTMGAMFAQTSGLPLKVNINGNDMSQQKAFFPGIVTLGDILEDEGYKNRLLIGSDSNFGGRQLYFTTHGNYEMYDYWHAKNYGLIPKDYYVWWGYDDKRLFEFAKSNLNELSQDSEPFNLTILTVDTHHEDGFPCPDCPNTFGDNRYANVLACSSARVATFINWCKEQPWYENTTIVIAGDHPTMDIDFCNNVDPGYERRVYTAYINSAVENRAPGVYRTYSTFDQFPTTLAAMGVQISGERLGLGTNLFSGRQTLSEEYGEKEMADFMKQKSRFMEQKSGVTINVSDLKKGDTQTEAEVTTTGYDAEAGKLSLRISHINTGDAVLHRVQAMMEKNGSAVYIKCNPEKDGTYSVDLDVLPEELNTTRIKLSAVMEKHGKFYGEKLFEYGGDSLLWLSSVQNNPEGYLKLLSKLDLNRYCIFMSGAGNAAQGITDSVQQYLFDMGFDTYLREHPNASFYFVKDSVSILQQTAETYLERYGYTADWNPFVIISGASDYGNLASIRISNGRMYTEYSLNNPGLNFVIWDLENKTAVNTASFNTCQPLATARMDLHIAENDEKEDVLQVKLSEFANTGDVSSASIIMFDRMHYIHKQSKTFIKEVDGSYSAILDLPEIDNCLIQICLKEESGNKIWFETEINDIRHKDSLTLTRTY